MAATLIRFGADRVPDGPVTLQYRLVKARSPAPGVVYDFRLPEPKTRTVWEHLAADDGPFAV